MAAVPSQSFNTVPQDDSTFSDKDGNNITIVDLRDRVIRELSVKDSFVASTLEKTGPWKMNHTSVDTQVYSPMDLQLIKNKIPVVVETISHLLGRKLYFNVALKEYKTETVEEIKQDIPPQVNMLLSTFKGTIVAGKV